MSAQAVSEEVPQAAPRLTLLRAPKATVSALGFAAIVAILIAVGLAGVMVVSTSVGQQSNELSDLRREATELGYTKASLESRLQTVSSANALALRATELGMVPDPYPAFINLADGTVTGVPRAVKGDEMPALTGARALPPLSATPVDPAPTTEPTGQAQSDLSAAGASPQGQP